MKAKKYKTLKKVVKNTGNYLGTNKLPDLTRVAINDIDWVYYVYHSLQEAASHGYSPSLREIVWMEEMEQFL